jgi:hypothetical protein
MPATGLLVEVHVLHELHTRGHWCARCSLPSALRIPLVGICPATCTVVLRSASFWCEDCGHQWNERQ